jgi:hypothetical protein
VNALLLWALCSNTFSLNEAAQASLKAKFKPSPLSTASKLKTSPSAAISAASSGGGGNFLLNKMASGGGLAACAPATGGRSAQQQQQLSAAALCAPKAEPEPVANDLRGE